MQALGNLWSEETILGPKSSPRVFEPGPSQTPRAESHKALLARMLACRSHPGGQAPLRFLWAQYIGASEEPLLFLPSA